MLHVNVTLSGLPPNPHQLSATKPSVETTQPAKPTQGMTPTPLRHSQLPQPTTLTQVVTVPQLRYSRPPHPASALTLRGRPLRRAGTKSLSGQANRPRNLYHPPRPRTPPLREQLRERTSQLSNNQQISRHHHPPVPRPSPRILGLHPLQNRSRRHISLSPQTMMLHLHSLHLHNLHLRSLHLHNLHLHRQPHLVALPHSIMTRTT